MQKEADKIFQSTCIFDSVSEEKENRFLKSDVEISQMNWWVNLLKLWTMEREPFARDLVIPIHFSQDM